MVSRDALGIQPAWIGKIARWHVTPSGNLWPEGRQKMELAMQIVARDSGLLLDFGCGYGRLAPFFDPSRYIGWDQNEYLIELARSRNREHRFESGEELPPADSALACWVFNHVPDESIMVLLGMATSHGRRDLWICETLSRSFRRGKSSAVGAFNRNAEDYAELAFRLKMEFRIEESWTMMRRQSPCTVTLARFVPFAP